MYFHYISVAFPIASVLIACTTPSAASPALIVKDQHHASMHNKTTTHTISNQGDNPRRTRAKHVVAQTQPVRRDVSDIDDYLALLVSSHQSILSAADIFSSAARNTRTGSSDDSRQATVAGLTNFQQSLATLYPLLSNLGGRKGLAYYDKSDEYETLLKDIVNANKNILSDTYDLVKNNPSFGPLLGPIVYDIKCILDEVLDLTENATDALLNSIAPLLQPVIQSATDESCVVSGSE